MALSRQRKKNIYRTGRISLGEMGPLSDKLKTGLRKAYKRNEAQGVLNFINKKRVARGIGERLDPVDKYGKNFNVREIARSRYLPERMAYAGAKKADIAEFDYAGRKKELQSELQPYFDQETADLERQQFGYPGEDINRNEQRGNEDFNTQQSVLDTQEQRRLASLGETRQARTFQEAEEARSQNQSFGQRGVSSLSPAAQRIQERLAQAQKFRTQQQERGYAEQGQDIMEQRRLLGQGRSRFGEDISTDRSRLGEQQEMFRRGRRRLFQENLGTQLGQEQTNFLLGQQ